MKFWLYDKWQNFKADTKSAWKSWTIIFNSGIGIVSTFLPDIIALMPDLQEYIEAPTYKTWMIILLVGNFILRYKTDKPLRNK